MAVESEFRNKKGRTMKTVDVGQVLDEGNWSGYQKLLIFGAASTIVLDGTDNQLLGKAVSTLMKDWNLPRSAFTTLYGGVLAFAVFTLCISSVNTVAMLGVLRFLSGLGLGGAMPSAAALASEYVPRRKRPFAVTLTMVCIPLGGMIAGYLSGAVLPNWWTLFTLGGIIPLVLAAVLFQVLPESPRFMARHRDRWPELIQMLRRLGHLVPLVGFVLAMSQGQDNSDASEEARV
jgi:AAHS family 4-hydroxybenzoate transporter-like MFS transporter